MFDYAEAYRRDTEENNIDTRLLYLEAQDGNLVELILVDKRAHHFSDRLMCVKAHGLFFVKDFALFLEIFSCLFPFLNSVSSLVVQIKQ